MSQESSLLGRYHDVHAAATTHPLGQVVTWYEELYREASAARDAAIMARCLADLAALATPHDRETALALTLRAAALAPEDACILENLAALRHARGQETEAFETAARAMRTYLGAGSVGAAACCLDQILKWHPSAAHETVMAQLLEELVLECRRHRLQSCGAGGTRHVLLLGDRVADRSRLEARVTACRLRNESPVVVTEDPGDRGFCPDALRLSLSLGDAAELPGAVAEAVGVLQFQRVEILATQDPVLWLVTALEVGAPIAGSQEFLRPLAVADLLELPAARAPRLSVVIPYRGEPQDLARLLAALAAQTLPRVDFEVIVVDDGSEPSLVASVPGEQRGGAVILRQERRGPGAARQRALERARASLVLFLDPTAIPGPGTLAGHLEEHERQATPLAVLGQLEPTPGSATFLVEMAYRAGLLFPYRTLKARTALAPDHYWLSNLSMPASVAREALRADETAAGPRCDEIELAVLLARQGVELQYAPQLECRQQLTFPLEEFVHRCRLLGHGWVGAARRHGVEQPRLFDAPVEPDDRLAATLLDALLEDETRVQGYLVTLGEAVRDVDTLLARQPERRAAVLAQLEPDAVPLLRAVFNQEVRRGVWAGIHGCSADALDRGPATGTAAVFVLHDARGVEFVRQVLAGLPAGAELLVLLQGGTRRETLPRHPQLRLLEGASDRAGDLQSRILASTQAEVLVFLDGKHVPSSRDWQALRCFLGVVPQVGAAALGDATPDRARVSAAPPEQVVATWRHLLEDDAPAQDRFLQRLVHKGWLLLEVPSSGARDVEHGEGVQELAEMFAPEVSGSEI